MTTILLEAVGGMADADQLLVESYNKESVRKNSNRCNEMKKSSEVDYVTDKVQNRTKSLLRGASLRSNLTLVIDRANSSIDARWKPDPTCGRILCLT